MSESPQDPSDDHPNVTGTLFVMLAFLVVLIGFWGYMYLLLYP